MSIEVIIEKMIEEKVAERMEELQVASFILKPWFKIDRVANELEGKSTKWIRDTFCKGPLGNEMIERQLIKKIGNEWHFRNPEFFNFLHDEWWERSEENGII